jgi:hypothetical protein
LHATIDLVAVDHCLTADVPVLHGTFLRVRVGVRVRLRLGLRFSKVRATVKVRAKVRVTFVTSYTCLVLPAPKSIAEMAYFVGRAQ